MTNDDPKFPTDRQPEDADDARAEALFLSWCAGHAPAGEAVDLAGRQASFDRLCAEHPELRGGLMRLREDLGLLEAFRARLRAADRAANPVLSRLLKELAQPAGFRERYTLHDVIGQGGQGRVHEASELLLGRRVAIKRLREELLQGPRASDANDELLARFLVEAQVTAQLDHPGVVAVHELALDEEGWPYFTMTRVRGRELREVFADCAAGKIRRVRCLTIVLRVCETMHFAHERGVVHRDLKPSNVLVGDAGEVFVMDWGLAMTRAGGLQQEGDEPLWTVRRQQSGEALFETLPSQNLGTVFYMAPEVAIAGAHEASAASDVYAIGAMLYELLAGRPPYWRTAEDTHEDVLVRVRAGAPAPVEEAASERPGAELCSIVQRAMAREPQARYPDVGALEDDLRAFLENRVVAAHATGPLAELSKWFVRNRGFALALAGLWLAVVVGLAAVAAVESRGRSRLDVQADLYRLPYLEAEALTLWPEEPNRVPAFRAWLAIAEPLVVRRERHLEELTALRNRALPESEASLALHRESSALARELAVAEAVAERGGEASGAVQELRARLADARPWRFANARDQVRHDALLRTVDGLAALAAPGGLVEDVRERLAWAETVEERTLEEPAALWERAVSAVEEDPRFGGATRASGWLGPQLGLVPLGADPDTGLQEFAFPRSGVVPVRETDGRLVLDGSSAIVFVLVPGAAFEMGAQGTDPDGPRFDAQARAEEGPVYMVRLTSFFVAKYELTRGQWERLGGVREASIPFTQDAELPAVGVSWERATALFARFGLELPTEAQWEYAARAGTDGPFLGSDDPRTLQGRVNLADASVLAAELGWPQARGMDWLDDGYVRAAPVGRFAPNAFGLHDVLGNVWEWCRDVPGDYDAPVAPETGLRLVGDARERVARGGGYVNNAAFARVTLRDRGRSTSFDSGYHGMRPVRSIR